MYRTGCCWAREKGDFDQDRMGTASFHDVGSCQDTGEPIMAKATISAAVARTIGHKWIGVFNSDQ